MAREATGKVMFHQVKADRADKVGKAVPVATVAMAATEMMVRAAAAAAAAATADPPMMAKVAAAAVEEKVVRGVKVDRMAKKEKMAIRSRMVGNHGPIQPMTSRQPRKNLRRVVIR